ncbi:MAG TPA: hypothetical protein EYG67_00125 [Campylobacterales bacterium]|nr:hypothetical protein [Campylobacterales bacterium]
MTIIDTSLGGTTPLDIVVTFKDEPTIPTSSDEVDEFVLLIITIMFLLLIKIATIAKLLS